MGYRSDVAIAIYGEEDQMAAFIAATRLQGNVAEVFNECEMYPYLGRDKPMFMLTAQFDEVKWYDGYPDVDRWNKFLVLAQDHDDHINCEFARIGEDRNDTVFEWVGPDVEYHLGLRREISVDLPQKQEKAA
tara:strand:- start:47 stop:442 length:396 start_codon:yes stop_codon:yes gene_type:complete